MIVVAALLGRRSSREGTTTGRRVLKLGVLDERRRRHRRRDLPEGAAYGDPSRLVAVLVVVWLARVQGLRRCARFLC